MIKSRDILYSYIFNLLENLVDDDILGQIENNITEEKQDLLLNSMQCIQEFSDTIQLAYINDGYFSEFNELVEILNTVKPLYTPLINLERPIKFCQYANYINNFEQEWENIEIDETKFTTFSDINPSRYDKCYFYENIESQDNSIIFFKNTCEPIFDNNSVFIFFLFLHFLSDKNLEYTNNFIVIKRSDLVTKSKAEAYLKLHLLTSGNFYHEIKLASERTNIDIKEKLEPEHTLQQFDDTLIILSEYNSRKEILNKFLSLYQIIENFMFKYPLVKLNINNNGHMFSIRNFKDMYDRVSDGELTSLNNLFSCSYNDTFQNGELLASLADSFNNLVTNDNDKTDVNNALNSLGINLKNGNALTFDDIDGFTVNQKKAEWPRLFSKMVYFTRNAIVHNKETEFHLSHNYLDNSIYSFVDKFLLPECENLTYKLIYKPNDLVWYTHDSVKLYDNS